MIPPKWRAFYIMFFLSHILATAVIDGQVLFSRFYPESCRSLLQFHVDHNGDYLMESQPRWLRSFVLLELVFQFPFFFFATFAFVKGRNWIRLPCIMYGAHASTTVFPILADLMYSDALPSPAARMKLVAIYLPYLLAPLFLMLLMAADERPFTRHHHSSSGKVKAT